MKKNKFLKYTALSGSLLILGQTLAIPANSVFAATNDSDDIEQVSQQNTEYNPSENVVFTPQDLANAKEVLKQVHQFTDEDLKELSDKDIVYLAKQGPKVNTLIGVTKVAKAIVKVWHKIPKPIKKKIEKYFGGGLAGFIDVIDHYTGTTEHIIYSACRSVGMSPTWANLVTKTINLFI